MRYINVNEVLSIHYKVIEIGGGTEGLRDYGLLVSALERPKASFEAVDFYENIEDKAGALLHSLIKNHPFIDGNKRTAFFSCLWFLNKNKRELKYTDDEVEQLILNIENGSFELQNISNWIKERLL